MESEKMRPDKGDKKHEEKCIYCGNYMDGRVLQAHILRKHPTAKPSPSTRKVKCAGRRLYPTVIDNFNASSYELWKKDVRSMMLSYKNHITSMLTTFNKPFGASLKPDMLLACQTQNVIVE